jgi:CCR4-NOT transcription complex subunit 2
MNRPGQAPQRPPSLASNPSLAGPFRGPYPSYGMPPRNPNVLQGGYVPGLQANNHRASTQQVQAQNMVPQSTPGFIQSRGPGSFPFAGGLGQAQGQHQSSTPQQHPANPQQQQQQQQANGASNSLLPHLQPPSITGTTHSASSASEVGLDPKDFPALGSAPPGNSNSSNGGGPSSSVTTSYASQAGTALGVGAGGAGASGAGGSTGAVPATQPRDFTPDDFPALGGQSQTQNSSTHHPPQNQNQDGHLHPPGLNGFQHTDHSQQHRQNLLGSLGNGGTIPQGTPGMLNLGPAQARSVHPGFQQGQTEAEKQQQQRVSNLIPSNFDATSSVGRSQCRRLARSKAVETQIHFNLKPTDLTNVYMQNNYAHKLNQATHAAWNSPSVNPLGVGPNANPFASQAPSAPTPQQNGTHQNTGQVPTAGQNQPSQPSSQPPHLNAPPGVPPPAPFAQQQQQQPPNLAHGPGTIANAASGTGIAAPAPYATNGLALGDSHSSNTGLIPPHLHSAARLPQTPAQQILMSAADRWGLLGLLAMIKNAGTDADQGLSSVGTDLGTMGLDMGYAG